jgi:putative transcriptional regulator
MPILYNKLFELITKRNKTQYYLRQNGISPSILNKLKNGKGGLDARTIEKLCRLLNCQPGDIMEYVPDDEPSKPQ